MAARNNILFLTNSELGQASVMLAVTAQLANDSQLLVHLGSFSPLKSLVPENVNFHCIPGLSMKQALAKRGMDFLPKHKPGFGGALDAYSNCLPAALAPWDTEGYFPIYDHCCELIKELDPVVVVLDPLLGAAFDASQTLQRRSIMMSPNTFKDHALTEQPALSALWKYSVFGAGYPCPLPFWIIPSNIYLVIRMMMSILSGTQVTELVKARNARGIKGNLSTAMLDWYPDMTYLVPSSLETDFPFYVPPNLIGCGPILPTFEPLCKTDPDLASWLSEAPTVVINMGSHVTHAIRASGEILLALQIVLEKHEKLQILWKLQSDVQPELPAWLGTRVKIMSWLPNSPSAILTSSDNIVAYVHHGGSNSYHEAVAAGVPQVVCPVWLDTYDFATRVEYHGFGVRGNLTAAPEVQADELARALKAVVGGEDAKSMREKAREVAVKVGGVDKGRLVATERIQEVVSGEVSKGMNGSEKSG